MSEANGDIRSAMKERAGVRRYEWVDDLGIPEFPPFAIRSLFEIEHRRLIDACRTDDGTLDESFLFASYAIATIMDEEGDPAFSTKMDREWLSEMDLMLSETLLSRIMKHCRRGQFSLTIDAAKKNSKTKNSSCTIGSATDGRSPASENSSRELIDVT